MAEGSCFVCQKPKILLPKTTTKRKNTYFIMTEPEILNVLHDAHTAHQAGDFVNALKFYEHFFDHALDDDPYALYAVRLSHCLHGWVELAEVFPGAKLALERKKKSMLESYLDQRDPERFHDYLSISRSLGTEDEAIEEFLKLHNKEPKSAAKLSKYIWDDLVSREYWKECGELLPESSQKMDELFAVFDEATKLKEVDVSFDNEQFNDHIVQSLLRDLERVVTVLRHNNRPDDIHALQRQFFQGVEQRNNSTLSKQVHANGSFLFSGH